MAVIFLYGLLVLTELPISKSGYPRYGIAIDERVEMSVSPSAAYDCAPPQAGAAMVCVAVVHGFIGSWAQTMVDEKIGERLEARPSSATVPRSWGVFLKSPSQARIRMIHCAC